MDPEPRYSLTDLARVTGVTPRTVRYYIAQGLLAGAHDAGSGAWYDAEHLARLRLIRELQRQHLPLAEIRGRLAGLGGADVARLLEESSARTSAPTGSALDYIRNLLGAPVPGPGIASVASQVPPPAPSAARAVRELRRMYLAPDATAPEAAPAPTMPAATATPLDPAATSALRATAPERSQWDRIAITDDIELHVRRPLSRDDNRRVERLITIARQVLGEEQP
ncbi:MAG: MerR family transcriptional regulator [Chloroflexi bacterium]|nr:MerR family transcriptional regulator [Chloroflexota bacterium]